MCVLLVVWYRKRSAINLQATTQLGPKAWEVARVHIRCAQQDDGAVDCSHLTAVLTSYVSGSEWQKSSRPYPLTVCSVVRSQIEEEVEYGK